MMLACPACSTTFAAEVEVGLAVVCPSCLNGFLPPEAAGSGLPAGLVYEVQGPRGEHLGVLDRHAIREGIYSERFRGTERVRAPGGGGEWRPIGTPPEFREVFQLIGRDVEGVLARNQEVKGWRPDVSATEVTLPPRELAGPPSHLPTLDPPPPRPFHVPTPRRGAPQRAYLVLLAAAVALAALALLS